MDTKAEATLSHAMFAQWIEKYGYRYHQPSENRYVMSFSYDEKIDCEIEYSIIINEGENAYLSARGFSDKKNRANERSNILEIINEFHDERRWPFCRLRQQGRRLSIDTCLDVDLSGGVHFELLDDLLREFMSSTYDFWLHIVAKGL